MDGEVCITLPRDDLRIPCIPQECHIGQKGRTQECPRVSNRDVATHRDVRKDVPGNVAGTSQPTNGPRRMASPGNP